jgi:hypothetical protein
MKRILEGFATLALIVLLTSFAQARPIETSTRTPNSPPTLAYLPDAIGQLNQLTTSAAPGEMVLDAAFSPVQQDTTPPVIAFFPPVLPLVPSVGFPDQGIIIGTAFDLDVPYIVNFGSAAAIGNFNVFAVELTTFFDYVDVTLPNGQLALGIGFFAVGNYIAYYDYYHILCPCGSLDMLAVDFGGNTTIGAGFVVATSF